MKHQMRSSLLYLVLGSLLFLLLLQSSPTAAKCNTCNSQGIACNGLDTFHFCYDGIMDRSQNFRCPENQVCVAEGGIMCRAGTVPDCAEIHNSCGVCDGSKMFTCLTRTTYAQCNGNALLREYSGTCPEGLICNSAGAEICVTEGDAAAECDV